MKRSLIAGLGLLTLIAAAPASAADLPRQSPYRGPAMVSGFNWTGAYLGLHAGYGWGGSNGIDMRGGFVGGQIGYNWQGMGSPWVLGVEVDSAWANMGQTSTATGGGVAVSVKSEANYIGSARARIGYTWDRTMLYATGGLAWASNKIDVNATSGGFTAGISDRQTHFGGAIGAGIEHAFAPNWSGKLEYLYTGYGSKTYFSSLGGISADANSHTLKVGLNYHIR